jgi:hypothetical protein
VRWLATWLVLAAVLVLVALVPTAASAATCSDYSNQAAAQHAADTRDPDHDGRYCEDLPCPCAGPGHDSSPPRHHAPPRHHGCTKPHHVVRIGFSGTKYRHIRQHFIDAVHKGWPKVLVLNRPGASARRDRLLSSYPTRTGFDRDEYPPAVGRGRGHGLARGSHPRGWKADVRYVPSHENRSHGSVLGIKLRRFCDGTRFRYLFY